MRKPASFTSIQYSIRLSTTLFPIPPSILTSYFPLLGYSHVLQKSPNPCYPLLTHSSAYYGISPCPSLPSALILGSHHTGSSILQMSFHLANLKLWIYLVLFYNFHFSTYLFYHRTTVYSLMNECTLDASNASCVNYNAANLLRLSSPACFVTVFYSPAP